jgi:AI-2 transport protein TqsA
MATHSDRTDQHARTVCLLILAAVAAGVALSLLQPVLVPFFLALFLAYCLSPLIDIEHKKLGLPRGLAVAGAGAVGLLVLFVLGSLAVACASEIVANLETYQERLEQLVRRLAEALPLDELGLRRDPQAGGLFALSDSMRQRLFSWALGAVTGVTSTTALVIIFLIFILLGRTEGAIGPTTLLGEIELRVRAYLLKMVGLSALTGILVGLVLAALGVQFAWIFGFLTFLLNFIPNVGSIIATLLPLPVVLLTPDMPAAVQVLAVALPGAIQFVIGSFVQPRVLGHALNLHPVALLMALIFFGMIWGIVGAFLAMPITGALKIVLDRMETTRPLAALLAGDLRVLSRIGGTEVAEVMEVEKDGASAKR